MFKSGKFKKISVITSGLLLIAVLSGSCSKGPGGGGFSMPPTPVETVSAEPQTIVDRFEAVGTIEAENSVSIVSEIDAVVESLPFHEGDAIKKGNLIAQLDDSQLSAELNRATALRDQSKANYERIKSVVDQGAGARQDLDDAHAALKVAEANLGLAKARFAKTRILAPFSGKIGARQVSPGAFLRTGQVITDLAQIDHLRINFSAPERFLSKLKQGARVKVSTTAYPGYELQGEINVIEPVLDSATRSARIIAVLDNPGERFKPGMSANISAVLNQRDNALTIPNEAVFVNGDQSFVFMVKKDSTVAKSAVTLGSRMADVVEVLSGLNEGSVVVRAGHQKLYDGARVHPVKSNAAAAQTSTMEK
ncbi:MAG: efflux RND transporter periplasmic adaptor subunit [Calditrichae bacterium]|nr:efflux RND transporter periplasmic adaptor subunit [Calditrichota bacterium]MCB9058168.1 efflux RND transporter periplasmic adaptor subunit [Calditrichia bacterium]